MKTLKQLEQSQKMRADNVVNRRLTPTGRAMYLDGKVKLRMANVAGKTANNGKGWVSHTTQKQDVPEEVVV